MTRLMVMLPLLAVLVFACGPAFTPPRDGGGGGTGGATGGGAGGGGGGTGCTATTYGSCLSADAGTCTDFVGPYWSNAAARATVCDTGRLSSCGCATAGATGVCHFAAGLANSYNELAYVADPRAFYDTCQNLGVWESTALSPNVTWWCKEWPREFTRFGSIVDTCAKQWKCNGNLLHRFECARDGGTSAPYPYACSCKLDGGTAATAQLSGVCGATTATARDNDDLLADAGNLACGWQAPNSPNIF